MTRSILLSSAGPMPRQVVVPSGIWVFPASFISATGSFCFFAFVNSSMRVCMLSVFRTIFFWPVSSHCFFVRYDAFLYAPRDAWEAWAAILPLPILMSFLIIMACFMGVTVYVYS